MNRGLINGVGSAGTPWSVTPAVHYSAYFQGIMLATVGLQIVLRVQK